MKVLKVFKFGTGEPIPKGAVYLSTQVETKSYSGREVNQSTDSYRPYTRTENMYVWHYFLVAVEQEKL